MTTELPVDYHAQLMRNLDEPQRNALIAQSDNVVDARSRFEGAIKYGIADVAFFDGDEYA